MASTMLVRARPRNYWSEKNKSILGPCAYDVSPIETVKATAPQVDRLVLASYDSAAPVLSQVCQRQVRCGAAAE